MLRRKRIVTACAALLFAVTGHAQDTSIRPFMVNVPEEAFVDLRRRLAATRWPSREIYSGGALKRPQLPARSTGGSVLGAIFRLSETGRTA